MLTMLLILVGCSGPMTEDPWRGSLTDIEAELLLSGQCPAIPPTTVAMTDGEEYEADVKVPERTDVFVAGLLMLGQYPVGSYSTYFSFDFIETGAFGDAWCESHLSDVDYSGVFGRGSGVGFYVDAVLAGDRPAPLFLVAPPLNDEIFVIDAGRRMLDLHATDESAYVWVCVEQASGLPGWGPTSSRQGPWQGAAFVHVDDDGSGAPSDTFLRFDEVDCASEEDASDYSSESGAMYHRQDCDGIDNDFDGVVDEGAVDNDENGIADCLEEETW
jgi:hypothetical protein